MLTRYNLYGFLAMILVFSAGYVDTIYGHYGMDTINTHMPAPVVNCRALVSQKYGDRDKHERIGWLYWDEAYCGGMVLSPEAFVRDSHHVTIIWPTF